MSTYVIYVRLIPKGTNFLWWFSLRGEMELGRGGLQTHPPFT